MRRTAEARPRDGEAPRPFSFAVTAERCPQILCRLIGLFAQQDRLIDQVEMVDTGRILRVTLVVSGIDPQRAAIAAEKIRQLVRVRTVAVRQERPAPRFRR
ncbi:hypothetical protein ACVWZA_000581 [Sphingomonas sp. UYAg733]